MNKSKLPIFFPLTAAKLDICKIISEQISTILINLKVNKAHGPDDISVKMIKMCGNNLCIPLKLMFDNI